MDPGLLPNFPALLHFLAFYASWYDLIRIGINTLLATSIFPNRKFSDRGKLKQPLYLPSVQLRSVFEKDLLLPYCLRGKHNVVGYSTVGQKYRLEKTFMKNRHKWGLTRHKSSPENFETLIAVAVIVCLFDLTAAAGACFSPIKVK